MRARSGFLRLVTLATALALAALHLPFFMHVAGDAQIHLVTAERFLEGKPFSFDDQLGTVVATTSPFWTLMLIGLRAAFGDFSPLALKLVALSIHATTAWGMHRLARDHMKMKTSIRWFLLLGWLTCVPIIANALGGLENILCALQLLLILLVVCRSLSRGWGIGTDAQLGLLLAWAWLTRPDGGALALIAVLGAQLFRLTGASHESSLFVTRSMTSSRREPLLEAGRSIPTSPPEQFLDVGGSIATSRRGPLLDVGGSIAASRRELLFAVARSIAINGALALIVLAPWYAWQLAETGSLLADSSVSRFYAGRRLSRELIPGWLYLNPNPALTLLIGFFPLTIGCAAVARERLRLLRFEASDGSRTSKRHNGSRDDEVQELSARIDPPPTLSGDADHVVSLIGLSLLIAATSFFTFVVGGEHFGRYFLPAFPFLFLLGFKGLEIIADRVRPGAASDELLIPDRPQGRRLTAEGERSHRGLRYLVVLTLCYLMVVSGADFYRRVGLKQHFAFNLRETIEAPGRRQHFTDSLLARLGVGPGDSARLAATEVQIRYYADPRITVLSLDGRTSAAILQHMDPRTGVPDFARYFEEARPDFVDVGQWQTGGGWGSWLTPRRHHANLLGEWKERISAMRPGDTFDWSGRTVTYVRDDVVRIAWESLFDDRSRHATVRHVGSSSSRLSTSRIISSFCEGSLSAISSASATMALSGRQGLPSARRRRPLRRKQSRNSNVPMRLLPSPKGWSLIVK